MGHRTISSRASSAIKGPRKSAVTRTLPLRPTTHPPMGCGAPLFTCQPIRAHLDFTTAPPVFAVKSTLDHKYFRRKWKPGTVRSALSDPKYQHLCCRVYSDSLQTSPSSPPWASFLCRMLFVARRAAFTSGSRHRRLKCVSAFAVSPHPEAGHLGR